MIDLNKYEPIVEEIDLFVDTASIALPIVKCPKDKITILDLISIYCIGVNAIWYNFVIFRPDGLVHFLINTSIAQGLSNTHQIPIVLKPDWYVIGYMGAATFPISGTLYWSGRQYKIE